MGPSGSWTSGTARPGSPGRDVTGASLHPDTHQIADITFTLPGGSSSLDYRLWIDGRAPVTLERVELSSVRVDQP